MDQEQIELEILEPAIFKIVSNLNHLYTVTLSLNISKFAKKRIKVDIRSLICGLSDPSKPYRLTKQFINRNLVLTDDPDGDVPVGSPIKQILTDILL